MRAREAEAEEEEEEEEGGHGAPFQTGHLVRAALIGLCSVFRAFCAFKKR